MLTADLRILSGRHEGKVITLDTKKFLIGRGDDCHMRPNNGLVSRHHCVFSLDKFSLRLRDLGSTNGTFVNDEQIKGQVMLNTGDRVRVGKLEFGVTINQEAPVAAGEMSAEPEQEYELPGETIPASAEEIVQESESVDVLSETDTISELPPSSQDTQMISDQETGFIQPGQLPPAQQADQQQQQPPYPMQFAPGVMPPPGFGYPQMPPGYAPQMPMGQFPYPQMPPGYPQVPMQGYPQYGMPMQGYPVPPQQAPAQPSQPIEEIPLEPVEEVEEESNKTNELPVQLPDPSQTGVKEEAPKVESKDEAKGQSFAEEKPSEKAQDIIQQYLRRRPS